MPPPSDTAHPEGEMKAMLDFHDSDCATHNMPAEPNGPCNCWIESARNLLAKDWSDAEDHERFYSRYGANFLDAVDHADAFRSLSTPSTPPSRPQGEEGIGPRPVDRVTCEGCPAFKSEWWKDHLDNDETDSGTRAHCTAADKHITEYWTPKGTPPFWCPALSNQGKPSS